MNTKQIRAISWCGALALAALAGTALACGDKLVALGGGVGFDRVVVSRYPGRIVLVLEPATGLTAANDRYNLVASLSLAGHDVIAVRDVAELQSHDDAPAPDLILVDASHASQLPVRPAAVREAPIVMPVVYGVEGMQPAASDLSQACATTAEGRRASQLLQAVEKALKLRSRGLPLPCEARPDSQQA